MPSSPGYERDYKQEYATTHKSKKAKKQRAARNSARATAVASGKASKGDGKDIDHKKPLRSGGTTSASNTRVRSVAANRSDNGHKPGETQKRKKRK